MEKIFKNPILWIIILAFFLRLISLNQSFWIDEATSANVAKDLSVKGILALFSPGDFHPPGYYIVIHYWVKLFGSSEVVIRMFSIFAGLGTIYLTYLIGRQLKDEKVGLIGAILLATSGLHVYYSQEARMYSMAAFFVSLTVLFFLRTLNSKKSLYWVLFSFFLIISIFTDYLPLFILPVFLAYSLVKKKDSFWLRRLGFSYLIACLSYIFWLPVFIRQLKSGLLVKSQINSWWQILGEASLKKLALIPTKFIFGRINLEINIAYLLVVGASLLIFGFLLLKSLKDFRKTKIIAFWLFIPVLTAIIVSFFIPTLSYFRFLFVLPAFYLLTAFGLKTLPENSKSILLVALVTFNLITSFMYLLNPKNQREDWRSLTEFVRSESREKSSAVLFVANSQVEAYYYYDKSAKILSPETLNDEYEQIWLMRYVKDIFDPEDKTRVKVEAFGYKKTNEYDFNGVNVWRYEK